MTLVCARCGLAAGGDSDPPADWSFAPGADGDEWLCPVCTREHVRSIEAKLPGEYW